MTVERWGGDLARAVAEDPFSREGRGRDTVPAISASENAGIGVMGGAVGIRMSVGGVEDGGGVGGVGRRPDVGTSWSEGAVWVENSCHVWLEVVGGVESWWWRRAVLYSAYEG